MLGTPWPWIRVTPDGLDGATCCPLPGALLGRKMFAPCGPYVPLFCHVADAHLGAEDEPLEQGEERWGFGWGRVVLDEVGGRGRRGSVEENIMENAALWVKLSRRVGISELVTVTWACRNAL